MQGSDCDGEIEARLRVGDETALTHLYSQNRERLTRLVRFRMNRKLLVRFDADDALQESYLAALQRLAFFQVRFNLSPFVWLRSIVLQTLTDLYRHHALTQSRDLNREWQDCVGTPYSDSIAKLLADQIDSPSQDIVHSETLDQINRAVANLKPVDREVLVLRHFEELNNREVAEVLGIQQKAASIRYVRAVRHLREQLSRISGFFD